MEIIFLNGKERSKLIMDNANSYIFGRNCMAFLLSEITEVLVLTVLFFKSEPDKAIFSNDLRKENHPICNL